MTDPNSQRTPMLGTFEYQAELLFAHHLDLLAQIEAQLRAVQHTMRGIERLRGAQVRVGAELSNGERHTMLGELSREVAALDARLLVERECCGQMQDTITLMEQRLRDMKEVAAHIDAVSEPAPDESDSLGG
jgi:hypothetical protein